LQAILAMPAVKKRLLELSLDAQGSTPEQASELLSQDIRRWTEVIAKSKIEKQ